MLPPVSREDPKPGRWVLPIVIVALIGITYVFVNALPAADVAASTSTTSSTTSTTEATSTTTTTLATDILAFLGEVDRFDTMSQELLTQMNEVNDTWEADEASSTETRDGFVEVRDGAQELANQVAATVPPDPFQPAWPDTITASQTLVTAADAVIDGFDAPDDGSLRRDAVVQYHTDTVAFQDQLDTVRSLTP